MVVCSPSKFRFEEAFSRTIGWITQTEQQVLRGKRIAIAGLGGVGGHHAACLARMGIGAMHLADPDRFELANLNRQAGAAASRLGQAKVAITAEQVHDINPECALTLFADGITEANLDAFLSGVDLYIDGLDFFAFQARDMVFAACHRRGIPAISAAPLGMGVSCFVVMPGRMSFAEYVRWDGCNDLEKALRFVVALAPRALHRAALVDPTAVNIAAGKGPSTPMACHLCAGVLGTEATRILLGRPGIVALPRTVQFDAYSHRQVTTWRPWGNANPLQRLTLAFARRHLTSLEKNAVIVAAQHQLPGTLIERVLHAARWAPSGDNVQPWRLAVTSPLSATIGLLGQAESVFELEGWTGLIAAGAFIESVRLAAGSEGFRAVISQRPQPADARFAVEVVVHLEPAAAEAMVDPLARWLPVRRVHRGAYRRRSLTTGEITALEASLGSAFTLRRFEGRERLRIARMNALGAHLRMIIPEVYHVLIRTIAWKSTYSPERMPEDALGIPRMLRGFTRWYLASWERVRFVNRWMAGTLLPRIVMEVVPGVRCAAHIAIVAREAPQSSADWLAAGAAVQRFWLTAASLGLQHQPGMTPLIFGRYVLHGIVFSNVAAARPLALRLIGRLIGAVGADAVERTVWMGRIGEAAPLQARSLRRPLAELQAE